MKHTVETSPSYPVWMLEAEKDFVLAKEAIGKKDFEMLGSVVESNTLKMHATTLGASPPFMYWQSGTLEVMERVRELRANGIQAFYTIDAGANVKILCQSNDEVNVQKAILDLPTVHHVDISRPGQGVTYISDPE